MDASTMQQIGYREGLIVKPGKNKLMRLSALLGGQQNRGDGNANIDG